MDGERDDDFGFQDKVAAWAWVKDIGPNMESSIQTLGDDGHATVEVVVPPPMDMVVVTVDEIVPAAVREDQVLAPAVKREEE
jgi:hypothetical protein